MIAYSDNINNINPEMLKGFFEGWVRCPSPEKHFEILKNSDYIIIAVDENTRKVVGFINAVSDKVLSAFIPLLEVLPRYQQLGIASELVKRMFEKLKDFYMIDLVCDENLQSFYERLGMEKHTAMIKRNYDKINGLEEN